MVDAAAALSARGVTVTWPSGTPALENVDLDLAVGELCCLIGANGAGKTTLLRALLGLETMARGAVTVCGRRVRDLPGRERARAIAYLGQNVVVPGGLIVADLVAMARYAHRGGLASLTSADRAICAGGLERFRAAHLAQRPCGELSGGELQRVLLARVWAQEAPVLLLDEATASLDPGQQLVILSELRELAREAGRSVLVVTHELNLAAQFADRIVLLVGGRVAAAGAPSEVLTPSVLGPAYGRDLVFGELASAASGEPRPWVLPWSLPGDA